MGCMHCTQNVYKVLFLVALIVICIGIVQCLSLGFSASSTGLMFVSRLRISAEDSIESCAYVKL